MFYQYGYFKPLVARKVGKVMTVRQLVPALLVAGLALGAGVGLWVPAVSYAFAIVALTYAGLLLACAGGAARTEGLRCALALTAVFPTLHFSYGAGFLRGIYDHLLTRTAPARQMSLSR
jgi:hypothetical protein